MPNSRPWQTPARCSTTAVERRSANQTDWDHRYGHAQLWSGNPNGALISEAGELAPGRARRPEWTIELLERRSRPKGSGTDAHHVDDIVLRARRLA